jgi:hypothetical protein
VVTVDAVAVKLAAVAPEAIVTDAGTVTALLLLVRLTVVAVVAADDNVAVHASVVAPVSDPLVQESEVKVADVCAGLSVRAKVLESRSARAVRVTVRTELTAVAAAVKLALVDPAAMVTEPGTATAPLLLSKAMVVAFSIAYGSVTVQGSVPAPVSDALLQESAPGPGLREGFEEANEARGMQTAITLSKPPRQSLSQRDMPRERPTGSGSKEEISCAAQSRPKEGGRRRTCTGTPREAPSHTPPICTRSMRECGPD